LASGLTRLVLIVSNGGCLQPYKNTMYRTFKNMLLLTIN
jgi:hypothetical protein